MAHDRNPQPAALSPSKGLCQRIMAATLTALRECQQKRALRMTVRWMDERTMRDVGLPEELIRRELVRRGDRPGNYDW